MASLNMYSVQLTIYKYIQHCTVIDWLTKNGHHASNIWVHLTCFTVVVFAVMKVNDTYRTIRCTSTNFIPSVIPTNFKDASCSFVTMYQRPRLKCAKKKVKILQNIFNIILLIAYRTIIIKTLNCLQMIDKLRLSTVILLEPWFVHRKPPRARRNH